VLAKAQRAIKDWPSVVLSKPFGLRPGWARRRAERVLRLRLHRLPALALAALCLGAAPGVPVAPGPDPMPGDHSIESMEQDVARHVNEVRRAHDRLPLEIDRTLSRVAREHSCALARRGTLSHEGPSRQNVGDRVKAAGKAFRMVGENLAWNQNAQDPASSAVNGWMQSPGHRENMLRPGFSETGIGICRRGSAYYFTQVFLRPA
jgi:uncharacterized protein YkwD